MTDSHETNQVTICTRSGKPAPTDIDVESILSEATPLSAEELHGLVTGRNPDRLTSQVSCEQVACDHEQD